MFNIFKRKLSKDKQYQILFEELAILSNEMVRTILELDKRIKTLEEQINDRSKDNS
jgi:hypothetical protein